jgi:hypothetical protein
LARKIKYEKPEIAKKFSREDTLVLDGFVINRGDFFKVRGEHGGKFKFHSFVTNTDTGAQWVDCFEVISGMTSIFRSFKTDRIKRIPNRGRRAKRIVN